MSWGGQGEGRGRGEVSRCKGWRERNARAEELSAALQPGLCPPPTPASDGDGGAAAAAYIKKIRPGLSSRDAVCCSLSLSRSPYLGLSGTLFGQKRPFLIQTKHS